MRRGAINNEICRLISVLNGVRKPTALLFVICYLFPNLKRFRIAAVEHFFLVYFEIINKKRDCQSSIIYIILYYLVRENTSFHEL
jgi:hypothetical protein